jgi:uncharacterized protein (TIGR02246 family)
MSDEQEIRGLLETYERSLNLSDATLAASCYRSDGVFMPTTLPTTTGPAMHEAYVQTFKAIQLNVTFTIDELVVASDQLAYALTRSNGTQIVHATGVESVESNREVFIFGREDGAWKISRYMFNKPH